MRTVTGEQTPTGLRLHVCQSNLRIVWKTVVLELLYVYRFENKAQGTSECLDLQSPKFLV